MGTRVLVVAGVRESNAGGKFGSAGDRFSQSWLNVETAGSQENVYVRVRVISRVHGVGAVSRGEVT